MVQVSIIMPAKLRNASEVAWAVEAIESVYKQTFEDWELVFVNDHSTADTDSLAAWLQDHADSRFRGLKSKGHGVVAARNLAAQESVGDYLLPLDADDRLPRDALKDLLNGWPGKGIVYGDTLLFGEDFQKRYQSPEYNFRTLLRQLIMPVGSLHLKSDWRKIGGWNPKMESCLEDWEYWINMGRHGVCGTRVNAVTYHYRRREKGRLRSVRAVPSDYHKAYSRMRDIHKDLYKGEFPDMCCTDRGVPASRTLTSRTPDIGPATLDAAASTQFEIIRYVGGRQAKFGTRGRVTNQPYVIPGKGKLVLRADGQPGVDKRDVPHILKMNRGRDFVRES